MLHSLSARQDQEPLYGVDSYGYSYQVERPKKPWKKVALAVGLLTAGSFLLFTGLGLSLTVSDPQVHGVVMMVIGGLMFLPGFYHTRIAYYAWKGYRGFNLDDIPDVE